MQNLIKFLDNQTAAVAAAKDKNAAVTAALEKIRTANKLDLRTVTTIANNLEFVYKLENIEAAAVYITATATKTPKKWVNLSYIIL